MSTIVGVLGTVGLIYLFSLGLTWLEKKGLADSNNYPGGWRS